MDLLDLGSERLSWRRFSNLIRRLPRDSQLLLAVHGDAARWGDVEHLLAAIADAVNIAVWQRGGKRNAKKPVPVRRPGLQPGGRSTIKGRRSYSIAEMDAIRRKRRGG